MIFIKKDFSQLGTAFSRFVTGRKICIVTDSKCLTFICQSRSEVLNNRQSGTVHTFAAGEESKNLNTVQDLYEFLIENHFDRKDMLAALGGGVVGDLTGFTAATYLRGISFIQIPTSLLAQVDSSIGGKTGVDFRAYKNMVGAFHQPKLVYMNMATLLSLDTRLFNSGFGEIIKHGLIKDAAYYRWLQNNAAKIQAKDYDALEQMIAGSCNIKHEVVELYPTDGRPRTLNFDIHWDMLSKTDEFQLYHGECVVLGMIAALNISVARVILQAEYDDAIQMFKDYAFPNKRYRHFSIDDVIRVSKKR